MSRPEVSVVMPFAGQPAAARAALEALRSLATRPGDELILADNSGVAPAVDGVSVVSATGELSPAHARNVGAEHATREWILFLDADCLPVPDLLDRYFADPVPDDVGAMAGEIIAAGSGDTVAGRYGASRNFLSQEFHLAHPFRPRAVAANLMVRRAAFETAGGFFEGVRAAEDTDFSWRLQELGWRLELRPLACVEHRYRATVGDLRRQWRGYAAGRAWLARRYHGFAPQPAVLRVARRALWRLGRKEPSPENQRRAVGGSTRGERGRFLALDGLLSVEELAGLVLSNRPARRPRPAADVVLVAGRFPDRDDPLVEFAQSLDRARVEAVARPQSPDVSVVRALEVDYREDDGAATRLLAMFGLVLRHPWRSVLDVARRPAGAPTLAALAPAVRRLERDAQARVLALGGDQVRATATRIAGLAGRPLDAMPRAGGVRAALPRRARTR